MFARVTTFNGDPWRLDDGIRLFQDQTLLVVQALPGFTGASLLVDRARGSALALSMWDSEGAMRQSEHDIAPQRALAAQKLGAGAPTVEQFEVAVLAGTGLGRAARVTRFETQPDRIDESIQHYREQIVLSLRENPGLSGLRLLIDQQSGRGLSIGIWRSEEALRRSEAGAQHQDDRAVQEGGAGVAAVERYEVAVQV